MQYPNTIQYKQAVQDPESFATLNNDLHPVMDGYEPVLASGNFAVVFKMLQNGKKHALKCFTKESAGRADRQKMIVEYIKKNSSKYFVDYHYLENELWIAEGEGMEVPVTWMEWVEAPTLGEKIKDYCESKDTDGLQLLVENFREFALWILQQPFAHGDLKHDNLLVKEDGTLVMVDYDGMFIPAFDGLLANELGSKGYQHPKRTADFFNADLDDFSIAVIYISLLALVEEPELYHQYSNGQNIIFDTNDFINPAKSTLIAKLRNFNRLEYKVEEFQKICENESITNIDHRNIFGLSWYLDNIPFDELWWNQLSDQWKDLLLFHIKLNSLPHQSPLRLNLSTESSYKYLKKMFSSRNNAHKINEIQEILDQFKKITKFIYFDKSILDLYPISYLENLEIVQINNPICLKSVAKLNKIIVLELLKNRADLSPIAKLENLTFLTLNKNEADLTPISNLKNLKRLHIYDNKMNLDPICAIENLNLLLLEKNEADLTPISNSKNLKKLYLYDNKMNLDSISNIENLTFLLLSKNHADIRPICELKNLTHLTISNKEFDIDPNNNIEYQIRIELFKNHTDLSPIRKLKNLTSLEIYFNKSDLSPLAELKSLTNLALSFNIANLDPLAELMNLTSLTLVKNGMDLTPIIQLTNLSRLNLYNNNSSLIPISKIKNLKTLAIYGNEDDLCPLNEFENLTSLTLIRNKADISPIKGLIKHIISIGGKVEGINFK